MRVKKIGKTKKRLLERTSKQKVKDSSNIEYWMEDGLENTIKFYIKRCQNILDKNLGMSEDDIKNDFREQIWKGLVTHNKSKSANLKTYLSNILKNRMYTLITKAMATKHSMLDYFGNIYDTMETSDKNEFITEETGESLLERREKMLNDAAILTEDESKIYAGLLLGYSIRQLVMINKLTTVEVISIINKIDEKVKNSNVG